VCSGFLSRFEGASCPAKLLEEITIIDTPGVLSGEKQRIERNYNVSTCAADMPAASRGFFCAVSCSLSEISPTWLVISQQDTWFAVMLQAAGLTDDFGCLLMCLWLCPAVH
jgi:hypothetical protein